MAEYENEFSAVIKRYLLSQMMAELKKASIKAEIGKIVCRSFVYGVAKSSLIIKSLSQSKKTPTSISGE